MQNRSTQSALIQAAGGLIVHMIDDEPHTVIIHRPKYNDWSFPKGKVDPGETVEQAALREVLEETALHCELGAFIGTQYYPDDHKIVHYWIMHVLVDRGFEPNWEVDRLRWVPFDQVVDELDHPQDRSLLDEALTSLRAITWVR